MITVVLSGGLGNQMFEYAAARALSLRLGVPVVIDTYALNKKSKMIRRNFELDIFHVECRFVSMIKNKLLFKFFPYIQQHRKEFLKYHIFSDELAIRYEPDFRKIEDKNTTLIGYFQNKSYFEDIADVLRADFTFKAELDLKNKELVSKIQESQSISVHIRRGDYLNDGMFAICEKDYYARGINHMVRHLDSPIFFVFSEDFEWVENNLDFGGLPVVYVDWNKGRDSYKDMQLMSLCKHHIIANSTFSWWAAWLSKNRDKMVIAPMKWFSEGNKNCFLDEFYPNEWIRF